MPPGAWPPKRLATTAATPDSNVRCRRPLRRSATTVATVGRGIASWVRKEAIRPSDLRLPASPPMTMVGTMQMMVRVGSDRLWAEDSRGSGPVLVLLHSGIADSRLWDPIWSDLAADFRLIRYDSRGYGQSPAATEEFNLLGDLRAVLDHFGVTQVHAVGC